jgi:hypothetical protein
MATNKKAREHQEAQAAKAKTGAQGSKAADKAVDREPPKESSPAVAALSISSIFMGVCAFFIARWFAKKADIPKQLQGHPVYYQKGLLSEQAGKDLLSLVRQEKEFNTFAQDDAFYKTTHAHIGEATPLGEDGKCAHPFLVPDVAKTMCLLPGRIDIAKHYILSGGIDGLKEDVETLSSRVQTFSRYYWSTNGTFQHPVMKRLFEDQKFLTFAKSVCPKDKPVVEPFQVTTVVNIPGQTVPVHIDAPIFFGADRFHIPQWLLATMVFSDLFKDKFIDQVQVVAYFHEWSPEVKKDGNSRGGNFKYWDDDSGNAKTVEALPLSGSSMDGSKTLHTATTYMYKKGVKPPKIDKSARNLLKYAPSASGEHKWELVSNDQPLATYTEDDLRFSAVYRARCFRDEAEKERFHNQRRPEDMLPMEGILDTLIENAVKKRLTKLTVEQFKGLDRFSMAMELMDCYVKYPASPNALFPFNYCAAKAMFAPTIRPFTDRFFNLICG